MTSVAAVIYFAVFLRAERCLKSGEILTAEGSKNDV